MFQTSKCSSLGRLVHAVLCYFLLADIIIPYHNLFNSFGQGRVKGHSLFSNVSSCHTMSAGLELNQSGLDRGTGDGEFQFLGVSLRVLSYWTWSYMLWDSPSFHSVGIWHLHCLPTQEDWLYFQFSGPFRRKITTDLQKGVLLASYSGETIEINGVGGAWGTCGARRDVYRILEGNSPLGSSRRRWEGKTKHILCNLY